jgi:predicted transposase YdaD
VSKEDVWERMDDREKATNAAQQIIELLKANNLNVRQAAIALDLAINSVERIAKQALL